MEISSPNPVSILFALLSFLQLVPINFLGLFYISIGHNDLLPATKEEERSRNVFSPYSKFENAILCVNLFSMWWPMPASILKLDQASGEQLVECWVFYPQVFQ
jgi:hypothetical protein